MDDFSRFVRQFKPRREQDADEEPAEPYYVRALRAAAANGTALDINCRHLHTHSKDLYTQLVRYPQEVVPIMDLVITEELERLKLEAALDAVDDEGDAYGPPPRVQVVRLQEAPSSIPEGETPHTTTLFAFDDLVDAVRPGDRVEITGIFRAIPRRVNPRVTTVQCLFRTYVDAIHFRKKGDERDDIVDVIKTEDDTTNFGSEKTEAILDFARDGKAYDKLAASLAPSIHGLEDVKRGNRKDGAGGVPGARSRGDINVLMCGDPGTSKSQLLGYVHKIAPRGVYTSGKGSSAVGLTASVQRDPETKELVMESGAVVLSDLGVCCIDEFDKMSDATRAVLHEAMEQQTISLAKAGIVATLNARASIFASANPVDSRYNPKLSVVENIQLPPTLLSRFDLIYLILDHPDKDKDRRLAKHIVALYAEDADDRPRAHAVDERFVRDYISYARAKVHPSSPTRRATSSSTPTLEGMIRIAESLARMRLETVVTREDVLEAVRLMQVATLAAATDATTGLIDMDAINTGSSALDRELLRSMCAELRVLVDGHPRGTPVDVGALRDQMAAQSDAELDQQLFFKALQTLAADDVVTINERAGTVIRR
ncbi:hypothetical protein JL720_5598 [Aureococcus anophagefferens]|nr:hypothetical protein JL720_5598 [Aureococcus anophagefferens]